jgi:HEPN domain-containing protein
MNLSRWMRHRSWEKSTLRIYGLVVYMKEYNKTKRVRELLKKINSLLARKEDNIRIHLKALINHFITEEKFQVIEAKMALGRLCD